MKKRANTTADFIEVYGWLFLFLFVILSGLYYFGMLDGRFWTVNSCTLSVGLSCSNLGMNQTTGSVKIIILNNLGTKIKNIAVGCEGGIPVKYLDIIDNGGMHELELKRCDLPKGASKFNFFLSYQNVNSEIRIEEAGLMHGYFGNGFHDSGSESNNYLLSEGMAVCPVEPPNGIECRVQNASMVGKFCAYAFAQPGSSCSEGACDDEGNCISSIK